MKPALLLTALLAACGGSGGGTLAPDAAADAGPDSAPFVVGPCTGNPLTLASDSANGPTEIPRMLYDNVGTTLCLVLDNNDVAPGFLYAHTDNEPGATSSSFEMALFSHEDAFLMNGEDVAYTSSSNTSLTYSVAAMQQLETKLVIRAKTASESTGLFLALDLLVDP